MPWLADADVDLALALDNGAAGLDPVLEVIRDAESRGIGVGLWPLMPRSEGYWATQSNAVTFASRTLALLDRVLAEDLATRTVWVDVEMDLRRVEALAAATATTADPGAALALLLEGADDRAYAEAARAFTWLTDEAHRRGFQVHLTTLAFLLDDAVDGDDAIARVLGTPIDGPAWDRVSFQVYRTQLPELAGPLLGEPDVRFGPGLVHGYATAAVARYGERAAIDLGLVGGGGISGSAGYVSPAELVADLGAAHAAGIPRGRVQIFALDGIAADPSPMRWLGASPPASAPPADPAADRLHARLEALDALFE